MELVAFTIEGYRRFVEKTSVKLIGNMIALVGPNEAGKSSLLRAMRHLNIQGPFEPNELPRRTNHKPKLSWHFRLEAEDLQALESVPGANLIEQVIVTKEADGTRHTAFQPVPRRDLSLRREIVLQLESRRNGDTFQGADANEYFAFNLQHLDDVTLALADDQEVLPREAIERVEALADVIEQLAQGITTAGDGEEQLTELWLMPLSQKLRDLIASEVSPSPDEQAKAIVEERLPSIEFFGPDDRNLASQYDLASISVEYPPPALKHLISLAGLDLEALFAEAAAGRLADVSTRRNHANERLRERFAESWNQSNVAVQFEVQGTVLYIQATTPGDEGLSEIEERSDGMRWFAALLAYAHGWKARPIILMDEIETHLHYDAQVDLIGVLTNQEFASKTIYTTHSFACLPFDLGTGIRVVQIASAAQSRLENGFWKAGAGFSPLLAAMGAAALSFTPARYALIGEGPTEAILFPTLFRQSSDLTRLPFQVVPGLSILAVAGVPALETEAGKTAFIVDGDLGGQAVAKKLTDAEVPSNRIVSLTTASGEKLEVEDLIDPVRYLEAVNTELSYWNPSSLSHQMALSDLSNSLITKSVARWCQSMSVSPPDKVAVAQRVVEAAFDKIVINDSRRTFVRAIYEEVLTALTLEQGADTSSREAS